MLRYYYFDINNFISAAQVEERQVSGDDFTARYSKYMPYISKERLEKLLRFKFEKDRLRSMAGSLMMTAIYALSGDRMSLPDIMDEHMLCADHLLSVLRDSKAAPAQVEFGPYGKPYLVGRRDIPFSLSHSGDYVALAIGSTKDKHTGSIGIDIQETCSVRNSDSIARRFYTESELDYISGSNNKETAFYKIWTAKEAASKAVGSGLFTENLTYEADPNAAIVKVSDKITKETQLPDNGIIPISYPPAPDGYVCCIAAI
ncbi:4'-phosphopantetheinyl transferase family protein [Butyrivibrio sp. MC2013]|uniref:4'-phosphopantetheinyl transferase family protein n=1 Tax=Butyrivibrio sp. MC2013 TaxID=1280686 RepID=UPI000403D0C0|nr:4'-phosphopantetheinyl transferase superfamily protein [Butyrivibrio sp. MC2013]